MKIKVAALFSYLSCLFIPSVAALVMMSADGPVALNIRFVLRPSEQAQSNKSNFVSALQQDQEATLSKESGALQFVIGQDVNNDRVIHLHEQYKSAADLEHHRQTPHFAAFEAYAQNCLSEKDEDSTVLNEFQCAHTPVKILPRKAYCLNVESCIKPDFRDDFVALMEIHQQKSRAEPGNLQFDWGESVAVPNTFYMHEEYASRNAYEAHEAAPHFASFMEFNAREPYSKPQVVSFFESINKS